VVAGGDPLVVHCKDIGYNCSDPCEEEDESLAVPSKEVLDQYFEQKRRELASIIAGAPSMDEEPLLVVLEEPAEGSAGASKSRKRAHQLLSSHNWPASAGDMMLSDNWPPALDKQLEATNPGTGVGQGM
jgi:hypothetical protein